MVYMYVNKIDGKRYIGVTCQSLSKRASGGKGYRECTHFWNAIKKYGWYSFEPHVMRENLSKQEADALERYLIRRFKSSNPQYGYNIQKGGRSSGGLSEKGRQILIDKQSGANAHNARSVVIFDITGKRIARFDTVTMASKRLQCSDGRIVTACANQPSLVKKHFVYYESDVVGVDQLPEDKIRDFKREFHDRSKKPVAQYDLLGNFISEFASATDAALSVGDSNSNIVSVLTGRQKSSMGFMWKYYYGSRDNIEPCVRRRTYKKVMKIHPDTGECLAVFSSAKEAAADANVDYSAVCRCARGEYETSGGYIWRYA